MKRKLKRYQVGLDSETYAISLVESPAIESDFIALAEQKPLQFQDEYRHIVYGPCLIPDKPIYRNDGEYEYYVEFTKESIEKMSQEFFLNYRQKDITLDHETDASEVYVVESWIKEDEYKDKSVALGLEVPVGTWMTGIKINNIEVWDRIMNGELKGFSVEAMVSLEELNLSKQNKELNMESDTMFWDKMKSLLKDFFKKEEQFETETTVETVTETIEETTVEEPVTEEVKEEVTETVEEVKEPETTVEEPVQQPEEKVTEPEPVDNHLNELIENLKAEIEALKKVNEGLTAKVDDLSKEPSVKPVNVNGKPSAGDAYSNWRSQMRSMM